MARRLPSQPPVLPGFSFVHILGSGGFADVFLFEQNMPRRQVAVKILLSEVVNDHVRQMFQAEANLMAQLSSHPSILTVYEAGVSNDGRPYLVMELCSSSLSERYRRERIPVPEVLKIAVRIGSAIETAHRSGVLHRDIKPSNILLTAYGHPVLSDFGIASSLTTERNEESVGLSIPWSAPEVLMDETSGNITSEVWAFAATVYSLLAGRSPFEVPRQSNTSSELMGRINRARPQPIGRTDVPPALEQLLRRAMSRKPEQRPANIMEFIRELQLIETELGLVQTPIEVAMDEWALGTVSDLEERTRLRAVPGGPSAESRRRKRRAVTGQESFSAIGLPMSEPSGAVPSRNNRGSSHTGALPSRTNTTLLWVLGVAGVLVVALAAIAVIIVLRATSNSDIPRVTAISGSQQAGDSVHFSWQNPGLLAGDSYYVQVTGGDNTTSSPQTRAAFTTSGQPGDNICVTVTVNRGGRPGPVSPQKCVQISGK